MTRFTARLGRVAKLAAAPALLAALSACATGFNADVSRFATQLPAPDGRTFAVVADDPALAGGLEFSQYADYVEGEMAALGYAPGNPETADLLVRFDYGVDQGRERVRSTGFRDPFYSPWYGYRSLGYSPYVYRPIRTSSGRIAYVPTRRWGWGYQPSFFDRGDVRSYTVYTSGIELKIDERATGERLFEGKAQALSTSNRMQYLVPNLVEAMFTDFPGNSGETVRITVQEEDQPVRRGR